MLAPPQAIAFDLDGTLVDSVADLAASVNHVRASFGLSEHSLGTIRGFVGDGARKLLERSLRELDSELEASFPEAFRRFRAHYGEHCLDRTRPYPGVVETLEALAHVPLAVVSNKPQPFTDKVVAGLGLDEYIRVTVGARPDVPVKPAPDLLMLALSDLEVDPRQAWMVGDSPNDIRVARAAGSVAIAVGYGLVPPEALAAEHPDALLSRFDELRGLLGGPGEEAHRPVSG
jgi:phosphoglycolate phosphatase